MEIRISDLTGKEHALIKAASAIERKSMADWIINVAVEEAKRVLISYEQTK